MMVQHHAWCQENTTAPFVDILIRTQTPTFNSTLAGRVVLDLFSEPDIFGIKWDALTQYNGAIYPALPDLYGPTMNVRARHLPF